MIKIIFYKGQLFKMIHSSNYVDRYLSREGMMVEFQKKNFKNYMAGRIIETYGKENDNGYLITSPCSLFGGEVRVHRLVARCFLGKPTKDRRFIDHIDGDRKNNKVENLRWVTRSENMQNPITRERNSKANKGRVIPKEHIEKMHLGLKNMSDDKKKARALKISKSISGKNNPMYGKTGKNHPLYGVRRFGSDSYVSKKCSITIDGVEYVKVSRKELTDFCLDNFGFKIENWFKRGIPKKFSNRITNLKYVD